MAADLLDGLAPSQIEAVTSQAAPLGVIAGPGSGKTRVLTHRVAWRVARGEAEAAHVLVLTFSRRAASELLQRLDRLGLPTGPRDGGIRAGTFHAAAWAELSRHRAERGQPPLVVAARPARLQAPGLGRALGRDPTRPEIAALGREIARGRLDGLCPQDYASGNPGRGRRPALPPEIVASAWSAYERAKRERRVLDLDDLLESCARLLATDDEAARAAQWRHRHIFVDEYQDLNRAHRLLLNAWVAKRPDVCVVGDPDQSVYGFNGASPDLFDRVREDWPGIEVLRLSENHRSTPEVVALAESIRPGRGGSALQSTRAPGPVPRLVEHSDDMAEAEGVARDLAALRAPGQAWSTVAVLARTNARLRLVAAALDRAGVPWRLRDPRPLADRPTVRAWLRDLPPRAPASDLRETTSGLDRARGGEADSVALLAALAEYEASTPSGSVSGFASWLDATGVTAEDAPGTGVDLATFHRSKGLEWPAVWVVGVEEGLVPISGHPAAIAEEQRLLYVAVTRARDTLHVSWSRRRTASDGSSVPCLPSRWVDDLDQARTSLAAVPGTEDQQVRLASLRSELRPDPSYARRAALGRWREHRARAARIPAAAVLSDQILDDLAKVAVRSEADVARVAATAGRRAVLWAPEVLRVLDAAR